MDRPSAEFGTPSIRPPGSELRELTTNAPDCVIGPLRKVRFVGSRSSVAGQCRSRLQNANCSSSQFLPIMSPLLGYLFVFLASLAVDLIPFFGPPAWVAMVFLMLKFDLNPWLVLAS